MQNANRGGGPSRFDSGREAAIGKLVHVCPVHGHVGVVFVGELYCDRENCTERVTLAPSP